MLPMLVLVSSRAFLPALLNNVNIPIIVYFGSFGGGSAKVKQLCQAKLRNAEPNTFLIISSFDRMVLDIRTQIVIIK